MILELFFAALPEIDELTLARAKKGDGAAMEELLAFYEKKVYNIALKTLCNSADAYDAAQDALIKIYRGVPEFRGNSAFSSWVYRITVNTCLDMLRKRRGDASIEEQSEAGVEIADGVASAPEEILYNTELGREILSAINALPEDYRTAVLLCDVEGFSYQEIAGILKVAEGTVKSRIFRGREKLKAALAGLV